jgi:uncharacterized membrane protein
MRGRLGLVFSLALVVVFALALISAQAFRAQVRLFPVVIGVAGLALALVQLAIELRRLRSAEPETAVATPESEAGAPSAEVARRRTAAILGWILAFALGVWLIGFPLTVPLLTFAYLRLDARERWLPSALFAAASGVVFYGLFVYAARIPFDDGLLFTLVSG